MDQRKLFELPTYNASVMGGQVRCLSRLKQVKATPEEMIRQQVLNWLLKMKGFDRNSIELESNVSFVLDNSRGRADIVLYSDNKEPMLVIECKKADLPLGIETFRQAARYANKLNCPEIWLTNGTDNKFYRKYFGKWTEVETLSSLDLAGITTATPRMDPSILENFKPFLETVLGLNQIKDEQQINLMKTVAAALFYDGNYFSKPVQIGEMYVLKDYGPVELKVGTAGGGYAGWYRLFVVATETRVETYGIGLQDYNKNKGQLCVGVIKNDRTRHDLQLRLLDNVEVEPSGDIVISHTGKMVSPFTSKLVREAVAESGRSDLLYDEGKKIWLGKLPSAKKFKPELAQEFLSNLLHYTLIRTALKDNRKIANAS